MKNFTENPPMLLPQTSSFTSFARIMRLSSCTALLFFFSSIAASNANAQTQSHAPVARLISVTPNAARTIAASYSPRLTRRSSTVITTATEVVVVAATSEERRAFEMINERRHANGLEPLVLDTELCRMAQLHSVSMAAGSFLAHAGPDGRDMTVRAHELGITGWRALGENIAYNQGFDDPAAFAVERWMLSPKHRENITNGMFTHTGLGVARAADGRVFFTQVFMTR